MIKDTNEPLNPKKERSAAYPSIDLETAIEKLKLLVTSLGKGPYSRESAAGGMGYSQLSGTAGRTTAALVHYALLTRSGNVYSPSELADHILYPRNEEEKSIAIQAAALSPTLHGELFEKYKNTSLPILLANVLIQDFRINKNVAREVSQSFKKTLEFAGFLKNGVISPLEFTPSSEQQKDEEQDAKFLPQSQKKDTLPEKFYDTPELPSGIIVRFPKKLKVNFALGEFGTEIKNLEEKAQTLMRNKENL